MIELAARDRDKAEVLEKNKFTVWYADRSFEEHELSVQFKSVFPRSRAVPMNRDDRNITLRQRL